MARVTFASSFFFFNDTATTEIYTLSLHDALPILCHGDESWASRRPAQRIDPPGRVVVRVLAEHGQHHVPALARKLPRRARQIRRGVYFEPTVVGPLPQVLQQTAGAPALAGDYENPQQRQRLPTRHGGRDRGLHANWWDHPLVLAPPRYRATSTSASSVPLPCRARI